jgi:glycerol uptake facilitator-like aquaporin
LYHLHLSWLLPLLLAALQEVVMTFTLISVVYACGVAKPGHGSFTPLAVGLSLVACAGAGGQYTGAALNPARVLGELLRLA